VNNILPLKKKKKNGVFPVQPGSIFVGDKELTAVGSRPGIRHGKNTRPVML
jgi:hypothetical protein